MHLLIRDPEDAFEHCVNNLAALIERDAADIVLPLTDAPHREMRLRCVVRPDREQTILLQHLGLKLPERLRPPSTVQM